MPTYWQTITNFSYLTEAHSHLTPLFRVKPFEFLGELFIAMTRGFGLSIDKDFVILACVVLTQYQRVTDEQTVRQTDNSIVANTELCV